MRTRAATREALAYARKASAAVLATARGLRSNAFHAYGIAVAAVVIATPAGSAHRTARAKKIFDVTLKCN
jgi:hypothetical protein